MIDKYTVVANVNIVLLFCILVFYGIYFPVKIRKKYINEYFEPTPNIIDEDQYVKLFKKLRLHESKVELNIINIGAGQGFEYHQFQKNNI